MPMCRFGCDELYERGFIGVEEGRIVALAGGDATTAMRHYIARIEGADCPFWNEQSAQYFRWHLEAHS